MNVRRTVVTVAAAAAVGGAVTAAPAALATTGLRASLAAPSAAMGHNGRSGDHPEAAARVVSARTLQRDLQSDPRFVNRATGRCLDSNDAGNVYALPCNGGNFQNWDAR